MNLFLKLTCVGILIFTMAINGFAQSNLYSNGLGKLMPMPFNEYGENVYYLTRDEDTVGSFAIDHYYLYSVDKRTYLVNGSFAIVNDTAFNPIEPFQLFAVSFSINPITKHINIFYAIDIDSSKAGGSYYHQYPSSLHFVQLDTNLNVTLSPRIIEHFNTGERYAFHSLDLSLPVFSQNSLLNYNVRDTFLEDPIISIAEKFLIVDDSGKLLRDAFLAYEPLGTGSYFANHFTFGNLYPLPNNGGFFAAGSFSDSISLSSIPLLLAFDSNLNLLDTFHNDNRTANVFIPGKIPISFGGYRESYFFLATGSMISCAAGSYKDSATRTYYEYYGIGKGNSTSNFRPTQLYFPSPTDTADYTHGAFPAISPTVYNSFDSRIYTFSSTHANFDGIYCINDHPSEGMLIALDTNLHEQWVKYLKPKPGFCIRTYSIAPADGRKGVLISGHELKISDQSNQNDWSYFIYYVDSTTNLGLDDPDHHFMISDQFAIFPNPVMNELTIENVLGDKYNYQIVNSIGQPVCSGSSHGLHTKLSMENYASGLYMVLIHDKNGRKRSLKFSKY